jgi:hypothetical protein
MPEHEMLRGVRAGRAAVADDEVVEPGALYGDMAAQIRKWKTSLAR